MVRRLRLNTPEHPNDIDPLTEVEEAKAFVEYVGSGETILEKAVKDFEAGDYRKTAFVAGKVVLANPSNEKARLLCADAFEQLGYVSESGIWRNAYIQGALELRKGVNAKRNKLRKSTDLARCMSVELLLKYIVDLSKMADFPMIEPIKKLSY